MAVLRLRVKWVRNPRLGAEKDRYHGPNVGGFYSLHFFI